MADMRDLGSRAAKRVGSSPISRTRLIWFVLKTICILI